MKIHQITINILADYVVGKVHPLENTRSPQATDWGKSLIKRRVEAILMLSLLVVISLVYFGTLYPDQGWGGDFAQYIHQAINIAHGVDMMDTGYIYSRYTPSLGPRAYPPGFPLLLAPTYAIFGFDMWAFQVQMILMQLMALIVIYLLYRQEVALPTALILVLMMGLSPYLISYKREIMSDVPFMLISLSFVLWVKHVYKRQHFDHWTILVAALLASAGCLIRTVGFATLAALLISDLVRRRRPTRFTLWTIGCTVALVGGSRLLLGGGEGSYLDQLTNYFPLIIWQNVGHYLVHCMKGFWAGPSLTLGEFAAPILWLTAVPLIIYGFIQRAWRSSLFMELFFLFHLGIILVWPSTQELRFLYPILPLFLLYAGIGFEGIVAQIGQRANLRAVRALTMVFAVGIVVIYTVRTSKVIVAEGPVADGPYTPAATGLFQFVREDTAPEAIFVFRKPRVLSLYTQRSASAFPNNQPMPLAIAYLEEITADYVIIEDERGHLHDAALVALVETCPDSFERVFDNGLFRVYHINQDALDTCQKKMATDQHWKRLQ
jgi:hypothetical protein